MTDNTQELSEIIREMRYRVLEDNGLTVNGLTTIEQETMQAILDWHNKQVEEIIKKPHILPKNAQHQESVKQGINFYHRQMRKRVDKLKESSNE